MPYPSRNQIDALRHGAEPSRHRVDAVTARALTVPTDAPEADGTVAGSATTMVLVQAHSGDTVGTGWTYGPAACAGLVTGLLADAVVGRDAMAVAGSWAAMVARARNGTRAGSPPTATTGPPSSSATGSRGRTSHASRSKIAESHGTRVQRDLHRILLAREVIGPEAGLYLDANGGYTAKQAVRVMRDAAEADVRWFEEPVSSDDLTGLALVRSQVDADVAAGEYGSDVYYFRRMCEAGAVDCLQIDATRAGGYTEWLRASGVAAAFGLEVSGHCAPNLHAPVAAATPNLRHVEWFHDHVRIESMVFDGALDPQGGVVTPDPDAPGHGLELRPEEALQVTVRPAGPHREPPGRRPLPR